MLAALDALIETGNGGRTVVVLKQACALFLRVGCESADEVTALFDELMATIAMDLDELSLTVLAPELRRMPGVLPAFTSTVLSRFHEMANRPPLPEDPALEDAPIGFALAQQTSGEIAADDAPVGITRPYASEAAAETAKNTAAARATIDTDVRDVSPEAAPLADPPREAQPTAAVASAPIADRRAAPRDPAADQTNPLTLARRANPEQLMAIAELPALPDVMTAILASRGHRPAIVASLRNPGASFSRSTLTMLAELAPSDRDLRNALAGRQDLPETVVDKLMPVVGRDSRARLLMSGPVVAVEVAREALAKAEADLVHTVRRGALPVSIDVFVSRVKDQSATVDEVVAALAGEARLAELAAFATAMLPASYHAAFAMLCARLDHPAAILIRALGGSEHAVQSVMELRRRCGFREVRETKSAIFIFNRHAQDEARVLVRLIDEQLAAAERIEFAPGQDAPPEFEQVALAS